MTIETPDLVERGPQTQRGRHTSWRNAELCFKHNCSKGGRPANVYISLKLWQVEAEDIPALEGVPLAQLDCHISVVKDWVVGTSAVQAVEVAMQAKWNTLRAGRMSGGHRVDDAMALLFWDYGTCAGQKNVYLELAECCPLFCTLQAVTEAGIAAIHPSLTAAAPSSMRRHYHASLK